jgi:hypothetical protein
VLSTQDRLDWVELLFEATCRRNLTAVQCLLSIHCYSVADINCVLRRFPRGNGDKIIALLCSWSGQPPEETDRYPPRYSLQGIGAPRTN